MWYPECEVSDYSQMYHKTMKAAKILLSLLVWSQHAVHTHLKGQFLMSNLLYRNWMRMLQSVYNISLKY